MFRSTLKNHLLLRYSLRAPNAQIIHFFQLNLVSTSPKRYPKSEAKDEGNLLFTMNYLISRFGFSPDRAVSACKYITFGNPEKPDSVVSFFHKHGFTEAQISVMVRKYPRLLMSDPENTLLPKIEFFKSSGFSGPDLASMLSLKPTLLKRSLGRYLIPAIGSLRDLFGSKEAMLSSFSFDNLLCVDLQATYIRNMECLKELGVPKSNIMTHMQRHPRTFSLNHYKFRKIVDDVKDIGFDPNKRLFLLAVYAFVYVSKASWEIKIQIYRSWGFSQEEIFEAFRKQPQFMTHSPKKIVDSMHYLIKIMGLRPSVVIRRPLLMGLSLQKRIIPRCSVYQVLLDKNLVPPRFSLVHFLESPEKKFLSRYVLPFKAQVPEMLMLYKKNSPCLT